MFFFKKASVRQYLIAESGTISYTETDLPMTFSHLRAEGLSENIDPCCLQMWTNLKATWLLPTVRITQVQLSDPRIAEKNSSEPATWPFLPAVVSKSRDHIVLQARVINSWNLGGKTGIFVTSQIVRCCCAWAEPCALTMVWHKTIWFTFTPAWCKSPQSWFNWSSCISKGAGC